MRTARFIHDITVWTVTPDGYGGYTFGTPTTIKGRWEIRQVMFRDVQSREVTSSAIVYVAADVAIGSYVYQGDVTTADPTTLSGAYQVRQFNKLSSMHAGRSPLRVLFL